MKGLLRELNYCAAAEEIITKMFLKQKHSPYFLQFDNQIAYEMSMMDWIKQQRSVNSRFKDYLEFIIKVSKDPKIKVDEDSQFIEQNFAIKLIEEGKRTRERIRLMQLRKFKVLQTELIDSVKFYGVFPHRKLNLPARCYDAVLKDSKSVKYHQKKLFSVEETSKSQQIQKLFKSQTYQLLYSDRKMSQFLNQSHYLRSLYKVIADLQIDAMVQGKNKVLGSPHPTVHLIQIQSYQSKYGPQIEIVSDVDFWMQGNPPI